jgi:hypothetical protein
MFGIDNKMKLPLGWAKKAANKAWSAMTDKA